MKGEELVQSFKEKRAAQRLQAEERLVTNMEKAQRTMERYKMAIVNALCPLLSQV